MNEPFDLPVIYSGQELLFTSRLQQLGYTHRFSVDVYGHEVLFEPDEEGSYRAIINQDHIKGKIEVELLRAVAEAIEAVVK